MSRSLDLVTDVFEITYRIHLVAICASDGGGQAYSTEHRRRREPCVRSCFRCRLTNFGGSVDLEGTASMSTFTDASSQAKVEYGASRATDE